MQDNSGGATSTPSIHTSVDLGDDLLEATKSLATNPNQTVDDQIETARILVQENMLEGAKTILHRLLGQDPKLKRAREILNFIHDQEIAELLKVDSVTPSKFKKQPAVDTDAMIQELDRSLNLKLFQQVDASHWKSFQENLMSASKQCSAREHLDLGIGLMTLGLFDAAIAQFDLAKKDPEFGRNAEVLKFQTLFEAGQISTAGIFGESLLRYDDLCDHDRLFVLYLLGRLYETLDKKSEARVRYQQILNTDPGYRDCESRLRILVGG